jgi:DNA-binding response OmpR family regulator
LKDLLLSLPNVLEVDCEKSYTEALSRIELKHYDVIVLDIHLGSKSGIDILRYISNLKSLNATVIMLTNDTEEGTKELCLNLGADYFLSKFDEFDKLPNLISKLN